MGEEDAPELIPQSDVYTSTNYGLQIYRKIGLIHEVDLLRLTGATGKQLKEFISPISVKLNGPDAPNSNLFPISLYGVPESEFGNIYKAKIFYDMSATHRESTLKAEKQISKAQSAHLFSISATALTAQRASIKDPSKIMSIEQLIKKKDEKDAQQTKPEAMVSVAGRVCASTQENLAWLNCSPKSSSVDR